MGATQPTMSLPSDPVFSAFLHRQQPEGLALAAESDLLTVVPAPGLPHVTFAEFNCLGLAQNQAGSIVQHDRWGVEICFPDDYLRSRPHAGQVLRFLGAGGAPGLRAFHPNLREPFVCMEIRPGMSLVEILQSMHELLTWRLFGTHDEGLNHAAAQWSRAQDPARFPVDHRPLRRRAAQLRIETLTTQPA